MVFRWFEGLNDPTLPAIPGSCMRTFDDQVKTFGHWMEDFLHSINPTFERARFNKKQHCKIELDSEGIQFDCRLGYTVGRCASDRSQGEGCPEYQTTGAILRVPSDHFPGFYLELRMEVIKDRTQTGFYPYLFHIQYKSEQRGAVMPSQVRTGTRPLKLVVRCTRLEALGNEFTRELVWWTTHFNDHMMESAHQRHPNVILGETPRDKRRSEPTDKSSRKRRKVADVPTVDLNASDVDDSGPPSSPHTPETGVPASIDAPSTPIMGVGSPHPATSPVHLSPPTTVAVPISVGDQVVQVAGHMLLSILSEMSFPIGINPCLNQARTEFSKCMPHLFQQFTGHTVQYVAPSPSQHGMYVREAMQLLGPEEPASQGSDDTASEDAAPQHTHVMGHVTF